MLINLEGTVVQEYRKVHLFDIDFTSKGGVTLNENEYIEPGKSVPEPSLTPMGYVGLSITNDLRYPELYRSYASNGAQVLLVSGAVLVKTGASHWESLLRARAIENQCYVVASNQTGVHH